jgi:hypothetical protein
MCVPKNAKHQYQVSGDNGASLEDDCCQRVITQILDLKHLWVEELGSLR